MSKESLEELKYWAMCRPTYEKDQMLRAALDRLFEMEEIRFRSEEGAELDIEDAPCIYWVDCGCDIREEL